MAGASPGGGGSKDATNSPQLIGHVTSRDGLDQWRATCFRLLIPRGQLKSSRKLNISQSNVIRLILMKNIFFSKERKRRVRKRGR